MTIELNPITSGYSTGLINDNFQAIEDYVNENLLNRDGLTSGEANQMDTDLDMNGNFILNAVTDLDNPDSLITLGNADARYLNVDGDAMAGPLNMAGNTITGLDDPIVTSEAARKGYVDARDSEQVSRAGDSMQGALEMSGNPVGGLIDPTLDDQAARKGYVDDRDAEQVSRSGDSMSGELDMGINKIVNLAEPTNPNDAARFSDVISAAQGNDADLQFFDAYETYPDASVQATLEALIDNISAVETASETRDQEIRDDLADPAQGGTLVQVSTSSGDQTLETALESRLVIFDTLQSLISSTSVDIGARVRTLGYFSVGDGGSNDYEVVPAATGSPDGGSYINLTGSSLQAKGLFPLGQILAKQFGAVGDGSTDSTTAIQSAIDYVKTGLTKKVVDLSNEEYLITAPLNLNQGDCGIENGLLKCGPSASWTSVNAALQMSNGLRISIDRIKINCQFNANGIRLASGGFASKVSNCEVFSFTDFGIRTEAGSSSDFSIIGNLVTQTNQEASDNPRDGYGIDINNPDVKLFKNISRYSLAPLRVNGNTIMCHDNHFYNGGGDTSIRNVNNILIVGGSGGSFIGNYVDKGVIRMIDSPNHIFASNKFLFGTPVIGSESGANDFIFNIQTSGTASSIPKGLLITDSRVPDPVFNGAMQFIEFAGSAGGSWDFNTQPINDLSAKANFEVIGDSVTLFQSDNARSVLQLKQNGASAWLEFGENQALLKSGATAGNDPTFDLYLGQRSTPSYSFRETQIRPNPDNTVALGGGTNRWTEVYAANGTINTSDEREKQQVTSLDEAELSAARQLKTMLRKFKWNSAVEEKGEEARWHFGIMAQEIARTFEKEGLDAHEYGLFCYDEWEEGDGTVQGRYGVRYDQLLAFIISAL